MTATIIPWNKPGVARLPSAMTEITETTVSEAPRLRRRSAFSSTNLDDEDTRKEEATPLPVERIYPHVFDENLSAGQATVHVHNAVRDAQLAVEAFGEPDLQAVATYLGQIAAVMGSAYPLTEFNESLGGVVAFVRRATLAASSAELSRSALNALVYVLQSLVSNPMLDLNEASDLVDKLANEGWQGEHKVADELVAALLYQSASDDYERQALLS
ncbi:MAG: hypothetical protein M3461_15035 [Pseudomonadota bacterium]|nr:hypothetical protein [Pseudomonadota bacterium]